MKQQKKIKKIYLDDKGFDKLYKQAEGSAKYLLQKWEVFFGKKRLACDNFISKLMLFNKNYKYKIELKNINLFGVHSLNFNRYLGCTTGIANGILYRTLDVSAPGLSETLHIVKKNTPYGEYFNLTWPGFVGVATASAPKRFSLAYNEAPSEPLFFCSYLFTIVKIIISKNIPPLWLTRKVMEECENYEQAKHFLSNTPICASAIYTLMGVNGKGCIIERTKTKAVVREIEVNGYIASANHWQNNEFKGHVNNSKGLSIERYKFMNNFLKTANKQTKPFAWLKYPIKNETTRFACEINCEGKIDTRVL